MSFLLQSSRRQRRAAAAHTFPFVASSMEESDVILNAADGDEEKEPADKRGAQLGDARASRSKTTFSEGASLGGLNFKAL